MIIGQAPLYKFLWYCNHKNLKKEILDCGAGGNYPPLSLFAKEGYTTRGIELDKDQLYKAQEFAKKQGQNLNIELGDMRELPFADESFSYVYSYNAIFHMRKEDIHKSIKEMKRVLKKDGLMYLNLLSIDDFACGEGTCLGNNEYEQMEDVPVIHSYYKHNEADCYFDDMNLVYKEIRILERYYEGEKIRQGFIDYVLKKV